MMTRLKLVRFAFGATLLIASLWPLVGSAQQHELDRSGRPGAYRLQRYHDQALCLEVESALNRSGRSGLRSSESVRFATWRVAEGTTMADHDEPLLETRIDLDNDGKPDRVLKTGFYLGGVPDERLHPAAPDLRGVITGRDFLSGSRNVGFSEYRERYERAQRLYGADWQAWTYDGITALDLFRYRGLTYVLARNKNVPAVSGKAYVFRLDREYAVTDVCMLHRLCPCGGCKDRLSPDDAVSYQPSPESCRPRQH